MKADQLITLYSVKEISLLQPGGPFGRSPTQSRAGRGAALGGGDADEDDDEEFFSVDNGSNGVGVLEDALDDVEQWAFDEEAGSCGGLATTGHSQTQGGGVHVRHLYGIDEDDGDALLDGRGDAGRGEDLNEELIPGWRQLHGALPEPPPFPQGLEDYYVPAVDFSQVVLSLQSAQGGQGSGQYTLLLAVGRIPKGHKHSLVNPAHPTGVRFLLQLKQWEDSGVSNDLHHPPQAEREECPHLMGRHLRQHIDLSCPSFSAYISATQVGDEV